MTWMRWEEGAELAIELDLQQRKLGPNSAVGVEASAGPLQVLPVCGDGMALSWRTTRLMAIRAKQSAIEYVFA